MKSTHNHRPNFTSIRYHEVRAPAKIATLARDGSGLVIHYSDFCRVLFAPPCFVVDQLVTIPGAGFGPGGEGFLRLSAFAPRDSCVEAVERLRAVLG